MKKADKKEKLLNYIRIIPVIIWAAVLILIFVNRNRFSMENIAKAAPENIIGSVIIIMLFYAMKTVSIMLPIKVIQFAAGLLFPDIRGLIINIVGSAVCSAVGYCMGIFAGAAAVDKLASKNPKLDTVLKYSNQDTLSFSFFLRTLCFLPMDVISMYFGAARASFGKYILGSIIGMLPNVILATIMGKEILDPSSPEFWLSFAAIILMSIISMAWYMLFKRKKEIHQE